MIVYKQYNRARAVEYARKWALSRNPLFTNFAGQGGDCTNFVSQCVYAGSCKMNYTPVFGWYYISLDQRAPAWTGVEFLYDFLVNNQSIGPFAAETDISQILPCRADPRQAPSDSGFPDRQGDIRAPETRFLRWETRRNIRF